MTHPIFVKRSVKEKLPEKRGRYLFCSKKGNKYYCDYDPKDIDDYAWFSSLHKYWLEEVELEEYLREINYNNK